MFESATHKERSKNPYSTANVLSKLSFWWIKDLLRLGLKRTIEPEDIYQHPAELDSEQLTNVFIPLWQDELRTKQKPSVVNIFLRKYGCEFLLIGTTWSLSASFIKCVYPLLIGNLVAYFATGQTEITTNTAYFYAGSLIAISFLRTLTVQPFFFYCGQLGSKIRMTLSGLIYRKCLAISLQDSNDGALCGRVINILSNDLARLSAAMCFLCEIIKCPLEFLIISYLMYRIIGASALIGVLLIVCYIPFQVATAKKFAHYRQKTAECTDRRVKLMNEIIRGIQVIKMYTWEKPFASVIRQARKQEIGAMRGVAYINATLNCGRMICPISLFISLIAYVYLGDILTAQIVFTISSYFHMLHEAMAHYLPLALTYWADVRVIAKRCNDFLLIDFEQDANAGKQTQDELLLKEKKSAGRKRTSNPESETKEIIFRNCTAKWNDSKNSKASSNFSMLKLNFEIKDKTLMAVVGSLGCGKTTLLKIMLGELDIAEEESCTVTVNGKLSYCSQEPWLFEGTIRDNILFVEEYNEQRYKQVLHVCALERDLDLMPAGDLSLVGERGITLSGGQKSRINLARAIYRQADIYLLDDPLSSVDTHVGKHIYEKCICEFLENKIRILVTHQLQYLDSVQNIMLIETGAIIAQGSFKELQSSKEFQFISENCISQESNESDSKSADSSVANHQKLQLNGQTKAISNKEEQAVGKVQMKVYFSYLKALESVPLLMGIIGLFISTRFMLTGVDYFLSKWVVWEEHMQTATAINLTESNFTRLSQNDADWMTNQRENYIQIYAILLSIALILYISRTFGFYRMCLRISLKLHERLYHGVVQSAMQFFTQNSSGRILNRFAKDMRTVDDMSWIVMDCIEFVIDFTGVVIIVSMANVWLLVPALFVVVCLALLRFLFISTSRSIKRLEAISCSSVYSLVTQTFQGLSVIRALEAEKSIIYSFHKFQNPSISSWFLFAALGRAFALWADVICLIYMTIVTMSLLIFHAQFKSGQVGLILIYLNSLVRISQWGMRQTAELENQMTSVERILEYIEQPAEEPALIKKEEANTKGWPQNGIIEFLKFKMKYNQNGPYVLNDLSFTIGQNEKLGIVGRTGAGKSSIIQGIFRLALNEGSVLIDGVHTEQISLHQLRSNISIIPQDPILFNASIRFNLDPLTECSDSDIWQALEDVQLRTYFHELPEGLLYHINDSGSNLSVGQRQLVCLARAILRKNKIIILDEATANIDSETDELIQQRIREKFSDCTVLTIAHRLQTVMDSDRVLVMDSGQAVELDHPFVLLQNQTSQLYSLVQQTGPAQSLVLLKMAENSFKSKQETKK